MVLFISAAADRFDGGTAALIAFDGDFVVGAVIVIFSIITAADTSRTYAAGSVDCGVALDGHITPVSYTHLVGYGMGANASILANTPQFVQLICGESGIVPAAFVAIILNCLLPREEK